MALCPRRYVSLPLSLAYLQLFLVSAELSGERRYCGIFAMLLDQIVLTSRPLGYKGMPLDKIEAGLASICPLKRVAVPQDIGRVVAFLASEEGEWINGMPTLR
jgi:hypothetical protein